VTTPLQSRPGSIIENHARELPVRTTQPVKDQRSAFFVANHAQPSHFTTHTEPLNTYIPQGVNGVNRLLLGMVFELLQADADTAEGMRHSMARGLPDLINYLNNQTEAGRLRSMHPVLSAIQLLAGPIVVNLFTRPLAEALIDFETPQSELLDEIVHAWLRAMAAASHLKRSSPFTTHTQRTCSYTDDAVEETASTGE
jgi:hypothetical protein